MARSPMFPRTRKFLKDLFMGPDGETWAIGRVYSLPVLVIGLSIPIIALLRDQPIAMVDVGVLLTGIGGACLLLIRGANYVDVELPELPKLPDLPGATKNKEPE